MPSTGGNEPPNRYPKARMASDRSQRKTADVDPFPSQEGPPLMKFSALPGGDLGFGSLEQAPGSLQLYKAAIESRVTRKVAIPPG